MIASLLECIEIRNHFRSVTLLLFLKVAIADNDADGGYTTSWIVHLMRSSSDHRLEQSLRNSRIVRREHHNFNGQLSETNFTQVSDISDHRSDSNANPCIPFTKIVRLIPALVDGSMKNQKEANFNDRQRHWAITVKSDPDRDSIWQDELEELEETSWKRNTILKSVQLLRSTLIFMCTSTSAMLSTA